MKELSQVSTEEPVKWQGGWVLDMNTRTMRVAALSESERRASRRGRARPGRTRSVIQITSVLPSQCYEEGARGTP